MRPHAHTSDRRPDKVLDDTKQPVGFQINTLVVTVYVRGRLSVCS